MNEQMQMSQPEPPVITLQDMATMIQIIDIVTRRGGFQGNELQGVGMLRNKVEAFVQSKMPEQQGPDGNEAVEVAPEGELTDKIVG